MKEHYETMTEYMEDLKGDIKEITCYLCGVGKIKMSSYNLLVSIRHPEDTKVREMLEAYLKTKMDEFLLEYGKK